jgi:hypothetical protein
MADSPSGDACSFGIMVQKPNYNGLLEMMSRRQEKNNRSFFKERRESMSLFNRPKPPPPNSTRGPELALALPGGATWVSAEDYTYDELMKTLQNIPALKRDMVLRIVIKTLRSAGVKPSALLDEGYRRLELLREQHERLHQELENLERSLLQRKSEILESNLEREAVLRAGRQFLAFTRKD